MTRGRVLLVDDEEMILRAYTRVLGRAGYEVVTAEDGEEGASAYFADPFDVVVTDLKMPRLCGFGLMERLRSKGADAAVIVLSSATDDVSMEQAQAAGARHFLHKPIEIGILLETVAQALHGRRAAIC